MPVLGIDYGTVRIGLAVSDEDGERAEPVRTIPRKDDGSAVQQIVAEANKRSAKTVVLGLPLEMSGIEGSAAKKARALGVKLVAAGLDVIYWDERLTTAAADRVLKAQGLDAPKRREVVDQVAATMLLQSWLDARRARDRDEGDGDEVQHAVQHAEAWPSETDGADRAPSRSAPSRGRDARRRGRSGR